MKTPKRVSSVQLSISLPTAMAAAVRHDAEQRGLPVSDLIRQGLESLDRAALGQQVDLRDINLLLDAANSLEEFRDLLHNTLATGRLDWDDQIVGQDAPPKMRADVLRAQIKRRLEAMRKKTK